MRRIIFGLASLIAGIALLFIVISRIGLEKIILPFRSFSISFLILFLAMAAIITLLSVLRWQIILRSFNFNMPFTTVFSYYIMGFSMAYLTPSARMGGAPLKAYMLTRHKIPFEKGLSTILIDNIMETTFDIAFSSVWIIILLLQFELPRRFETLIIVFLILAFIFSSIFFIRLYRGKVIFSAVFNWLKFLRIKLAHELLEKIKIIDTMFGLFLRKKKMALLWFVIISFFVWAVGLIEYKVALLAINYNASIFELFLIIVFAVIAAMVPIPASLGVLELGQVSVFTMLGIDPYIGIALAIILRFRDVLLALVGLILIYSFSISKLRIIFGKWIQQ